MDKPLISQYVHRLGGRWIVFCRNGACIGAGGGVNAGVSAGVNAVVPGRARRVQGAGGQARRAYNLRRRPAPYWCVIIKKTN